MASTTAAIREALRAAIKLGVGAGWQVSAYMLALPKPPSVDVRPSGTTFDLAMGRGLDDLEFTVRAMVSFNNDKGAQTRLDGLLDSTSATGLKTAIEIDKTLGGVVSDLRVQSASDYKALIMEGQPPLLAVEFIVEVLPT